MSESTIRISWSCFEDLKTC